jgi:hypothetical protein
LALFWKGVWGVELVQLLAVSGRNRWNREHWFQSCRSGAEGRLGREFWPASDDLAGIRETVLLSAVSEGFSAGAQSLSAPPERSSLGRDAGTDSVARKALFLRLHGVSPADPYRAFAEDGKPLTSAFSRRTVNSR